MIPQFVGAGTGIEIATGTSTVSKTTCTAGNLIVAHYLCRGATDDVTRSNVVNITNLATTPNNSINPIAINRDVGLAGGNKHGMYAGRVTANGTCSADFTVGASGNDIAVRMYEFSDEIQGNTDDGVGLFENESGAQVQTNFGTGTTVTDRSVQTLGSDRLAVSLLAVAANQALDDFTGETGGDWAEAVAEFASATGTLQVQTAQMPSAGTIDGGSFTISSADWGVISFGIIPEITAGVTASIGFMSAVGW